MVDAVHTYTQKVVDFLGAAYNDARDFVIDHKQKVVLALLAAYVVTLPVVGLYLVDQRYVLSALTNQLVGETSSSLTKNLAYDASSQSYYLNKAAIKSSSSGNGQTGLPNNIQHARIGSGTGASASRNLLYSAKLPTNLSQGITYYDDNLGLSFSVVPTFQTMGGREDQGRMVYPYGSNAQMIYTPKGNGLQEALILKHSIGDTLELTYKLNLPDTLQARMLNNGSGDVGIYSADPTLFSNISFGSDVADQAKIESARATAPKTYLDFVLPAPEIASAGSSHTARSQFMLLNGNILTLEATGLNSATYPVSIDPSVVLTSTNDFAQTAGDVSDIDFSTAGQINRAAVSGGAVGSWNSTSSFTTGRSYFGTVAYNGYLYMIGGYTGSAQSDVQYAQINSNGTLGSWGTTTSLPAGRWAEGALAYNGYLYVVGGTGLTSYNDVTEAPINSNGTIGSWTTMVAGFSTARYGLQAVAYNGYLYLLGGTGASGYLDDVQYAPIYANGMTGSWSTTTSFTTARDYFGAEAYNGYLYLLGGTGASGYLDDVQYAPINSNGTIGSWNTTTSLPAAADNIGVTIASGYMYIVGGFTGSGYIGSEYAPIYANGSVGSWTASSNYTTLRYGNGAASYNGYVYILGGYGGSNLNDVQYAQISSPGTTSSYGTTTTLPTGLNGDCSVAYNGYLYELGGQDTSGTYYNTVQYATLNANGTIGSWASTTGFTTARWLFGCAVSNGYLYILGGQSSGGYMNDVQYAPINSDGTVGTWNSTNSFTTARFLFQAEAYNGYLYVIGGVSSGPNLSDVQYASINSNGTVGTWNTTTALPQTLGEEAAAVYNGYLYTLGGDYGSSSNVTTVLYAPINSNGTVGSWNTTTSFTNGCDQCTSVTSNGYVYILGGDGTTGQTLSVVQAAPINGNGTVGAWVTTASLATGVRLLSATAYNGNIYVIGGQNSSGTAITTVQYAQINSGGSGATGTWTSTNGVTTAREGNASIAYNGYLYTLGGYTGSIFENDVQYSAITSTGTLAGWGSTSSFTTGRDLAQVQIYNGYMYLIGGYDGSTLNDVQYAPINANGTLGSWSSTASFTDGRYGFGSAAYNGYLYVLGGSDGTNNLDDVQYASINTNGTLSSWGTTTSFPDARFGIAATSYDGYLYVLGGEDTTSSTNTVDYAPLNSNGTVGSWSATSNFVNGRRLLDAVAYNGYIYLIGGQDNSGGLDSDVQYAPIGSNGGVGPWVTDTASMSAGLWQFGAAIYKGYLYTVAGDTQSSGEITTAYYTPLTSIGRVGHYTALINFGTNTIPNSITYDGQLANGLASVSYELAGSNGVFGAASPASSLAGATPSTCGASNDGGYVAMMLIVTLDDSQTVTYPDAAANASTLDDITVNYSGARPLPSVRLRLGQYFGSDSLTAQPLDTCH